MPKKIIMPQGAEHIDKVARNIASIETMQQFDNCVGSITNMIHLIQDPLARRELYDKLKGRVAVLMDEVTERFMDDDITD